MRRRAVIKTVAVGAGLGPSVAGAFSSLAFDDPAGGCRSSVAWKPMVPATAGVPALDGHTDTVPDIVGRLGSPIGLAIFTEGNHFPALFGAEIIEPFRAWARGQAQYAALPLDNIVVVTLPQPMIVDALLGQGISLGNLTLEVSRTSGFYPDIVMGGRSPLARLRSASMVESDARVFARNRGLSLLVATASRHAVHRLEDLTQPGLRFVMATKGEPGARGLYISALNGLLGEEATTVLLSRETMTFPGRLGIQHRDILQAIAVCAADVGIIFHHLARYFATNYPQLCAMVTVPGAEKFSSTIAMVTAVNPLRAEAAKAFKEFFLAIARDVYPRYGFEIMNEAEFGAIMRLD